MTEPVFPNQHTTTTTVQTSSTTVETTLRFDSIYLRTLHGILKCVEIVLNLLGFICIEASGPFSYHSRGAWFNFVSMTGFWFTGILLVFYLFHIIEKFYKLPWLKIEFAFCAIWTILYLIAAALAVSYGNEAYVAAGFFGFCAMVAYGIDAFLKFQAFKRGELAQGQRVTTKQTSVISPAN